MLVLIVLLWRQLSRWVAQLCGQWVFYRNRKQGKKWLRQLVPPLPKDEWDKMKRKDRELASRDISAQRMARVNKLFQETPIPDFDLCRSSRLRTDLEKVCRFKGSILKWALKWILYYIGLWWIADFRADKDRYKSIFDKAVKEREQQNEKTG
jgi:hypothetical protein